MSLPPLLTHILDLNQSTTGKPGTVDNPYLFDASDTELDWFMLVCMVVAGKNARVQQAKLWAFFRDLGYPPDSPEWLPAINLMDGTELDARLRAVGMGQYARLVRGMKTFARLRVEGGLDLRTCAREDLVKLPGVGLKTATFFLLYTREELRDMACLDTHILKFLRDSGLAPDAPVSTPAPRKYFKLERLFTDLCKEVGRRPAEIDFEIWSFYRNKQNVPILLQQQARLATAG